ncbi:MAG: MerR family transcriptional regulator [Candidatus Margulisiibacteriota bacterium]
MYSIGEFSKITGITSKALRHYHEIGLLVPDKRDEVNNYRFYGEQQIEPALIISELKEVGFSLEEIGKVLANQAKEKSVLKLLDEQKQKIGQEIEINQSRIQKLEKLIKEREDIAMENMELSVQEKTLPAMLVACIKHQGRYKEVGPLFMKLGRALGPNIAGPAMTLYYDEECREDDATFEAAMPIRKKVNKEGIAIKELKGGLAVTLIHKGPYETIGNSYKKMIDYLKKKNLKPKLPSREVYLKGPRFLFNNPKKYITEIQYMLTE